MKADMKILIIDDNKDYANGLLKLFSYAGFSDVRCAYFGQSGIETASEMNPDVLLVDLQMPDMDGFAVIKAIKKQASKRALICIAVTGYGQDSDKKRTSAADFDFHLTKPFSFSELKKILKISDTQKTVTSA